MIFTYWQPDPENQEAPDCPDGVLAWRQHYPDMALFTQDEAVDALAEFGAPCVDLFRRIRMPACQSDLARLALLYRFGGLYVDSHTGPGTVAGLLTIFELLAANETVLFEKSWELDHGSVPRLVNGVLCARKRSPVIRLLFENALRNLASQEQKEFELNGFSPYNLAVLSGAWNIRVSLFDMSSKLRVLKDEFLDSVHIKSLQKRAEDGVLLYRHYGYRKAGRHWSERQHTERLFLARSKVSDYPSSVSDASELSSSPNVEGRQVSPDGANV